MPKSVCAVEMTMYVHWTCINVNRKDVHASVELRRWVHTCSSVEKMKTQLCFSLKTFSSYFS